MMNGTELSWNVVKVIYLIPDGVNLMTSFRRKLLDIIILQIENKFRHDNNLTDEEKTKIDELTLRRDQELEVLEENNVRYQHIIQTLLPVIQKELQIALKNPKVTAESKSQLLTMRKEL